MAIETKGFAFDRSPYDETVEWYTPKPVFDALGVEFDMDVCSPGKDVVPWIPAKQHITPEEDGLAQKWHGCVWMNPPYGDQTAKWLRRLAEYRNGIGLVFSRTDNKWFHEYVANADMILFTARRVQFVRGPEQAEVYARTFRVKNKGCGAGSIFVAYGEKACNALSKSGLGTIFVRR
jgi:hypothetical protein